MKVYFLLGLFLIGAASADKAGSKSEINYQKATQERIQFYTKTIKEFQTIEHNAHKKGTLKGYREYSDGLYHLKNLKDIERQLRRKWEDSRRVLLKGHDDEKKEDLIDKQQDRFDELSDTFFEEYENAVNAVLKA
ncbi:hypothetical protein K7432_007495 [Basidiobolus ranarum]|uniref:Uncharacterized protein n=1 Tax=Basidiobolus ranarum TaxID=34480 RepID=A0ABR2WT94_9FUNG